jgi:hypothetical protein
MARDYGRPPRPGRHRFGAATNVAYRRAGAWRTASRETVVLPRRSRKNPGMKRRESGPRAAAKRGAAAGRSRKSRPAKDDGAGVTSTLTGSPALVEPTTELEGLLDEVKATAIALLASLQEKEKTLCDRADTEPTAGVARGLSDIRALRVWADRTLRTIEVVERGRSGEVEKLLEELGEFGEILKNHQSHQ